MQLVSVTSAEEQWRSVARPWLLGQARDAWRDARPTVVLTPGRAEGFYLRGRLVAERVPLLGLRFWTPSDARRFLLGQYAPDLAAPTQAELRLLARLCAQRLAAVPDAPDNATLASVERDPAAFLRSYDLLLGAGWDPVRDGVAYGRELAGEFQRTLARHRLATQAGLHRRLWRAAAEASRPLLARLLILGFDAAHWPLWDLLKAAALSAEQTIVVLTQPRGFAAEPDRLWHGSWEQFAQTASEPAPPIDNGTARPFAALAQAYEDGAPCDASTADLTFCITPDFASQVRGVVLRAFDYLRRDDATRLGIVGRHSPRHRLPGGQRARPRPSPPELQRLGVPCDDGTGAAHAGSLRAARLAGMAGAAGGTRRAAAARVGARLRGPGRRMRRTRAAFPRADRRAG
ncbi:MAG: hypothetical protein WDO13_20130 [Verrucomicrobiota bacterium]